MPRTSAAFGMVINVLPPALADHIFFSPSSPMPVSFSSTLFAAGVLRAAAEPPAWAYAIPVAPPAAAPATPAAPPDPTLKQIPGSRLTFTRQQIADGFGPADWFPGDHPPMPEIVAHGKRPD